MPNEFIARNGIIALNNSIVTGSLTATVGITGSFSGSLSGTASYASNALSASYAVNAGSAQSASFATNASSVQSASFATNAVNALTASFVTSSNVRGPLGVNSILSASYASGSTSSSYAVNAGSAQSASFATNAASAFIQGGNSFGATATIGTNDTQNLALETNGNVRMTISSSGPIGIGTTTPTLALLQVQGNVSASSYSGSLLGTASFATSASWAPAGAAAAGTSNFIATGSVSASADVNPAQIFRIISGSSTFLTVSGSTGYVGLGTTTPSAKFEIKSSNTSNLGGLLLRATSNSNFPAILYENSTNGGTLDLYNNASLATRISANGNSYISSSGGNFGIGTTSPDAPLRVAGTINATHSIFGNTDGRGLAIQTVLVAGTNEAGSILNARGVGGGTLIFQTDNTEIARINSTGVGIGTTSPSYPLQVRRAGGAGSLGISIDGVGSTDRTVQYFAVQDSAAGVGAGHAFYYRAPSSTTDTFGFILDEAGNVGIGFTVPTGKLHISGSGVSMLRIESQDNSDTIPTVYIEGNKGGSAPYTATLIELRSNLDARGRGIFMTAGGTNNEWFAGVPYLAGGYQIGYDGSANGLPYVPESASLFINTSRNVGIGSTSPTEKLFVSGNIAMPVGNYLKAGPTNILIGSSGNYHTLYSQANNIAIYLGGSGDAGNYYDNTNHYFRNIGGGTTYAFLGTAGNLGVGTTNPSYRITAFNTSLDSHLAAEGGAPSLNLLSGSGGRHIGTVGLATSAGHFITPTSAGDLVIMTRGLISGSIVFGIGASERVRITATTGSMGINISSPTAMLHVSGNIRTDQPAGGTTSAAAYRWGSVVVTSGLTLLTTRYVEVEIDGTVRKVALVN